MSTYEQFLSTKNLGSAVGSTAPAVVIAGKDGSGNAAPLTISADGVAVYDAQAAAKLEALKGFVDGVEALIGATNTAISGLQTSLTALQGYTDGLETLVGTSNTNLTQIHTDLATTLAGLITSLNTYVDGLEGLAAAATPAGENFIGGVGGRAAVVPVAMTRPSDATTYTAGDMFGNLTANSGNNIFTLPVSRANDKSAIISRIRAKIKGSANWAGKQIKFHFFKSLPVVTTIGDNGAFAGGNSTTESNKIGTATVTFDSTQTSDGFVKGFSYPDDTAGVVWTVEPATGTPNIYAIAEVVGAVTPAALDILTLTLEVAGQN